MKAIVAVDEKWGIGKNNDLLFSIPEDMKFFRQTTLNKVVVMGSNTLRSFPNSSPLKNRINIVLSTKLNRDDCLIVNSIDSLLDQLKKYGEDDVFVIGGAMLYRELLPYCKEAFVTKVFADGSAQKFFPILDELSGWECVEQSEPLESNGYRFKFTKYKNFNVKKL